MANTSSITMLGVMTVLVQSVQAFLAMEPASQRSGHGLLMGTILIHSPMFS
jgi:hypothetical protein